MNAGIFILVIAGAALLVAMPCSVHSLSATAYPPIPAAKEGPGPVNESLADFYRDYPRAKNMTVFASFINEHGFGGWYADTAYEGFDRAYPDNGSTVPVSYDYVFLLPGKNYTKKFVALYQTRSRMIKDSSHGIVWLKEINVSEDLRPASSEEDLLSSFSEMPKGPMHWLTGREVFENTYPETKNNTTITGFIDLYGMRNESRSDAYGNYYGYPARYEYYYVYIIPEKDYPYKLVFLYNFSARRYNVSEQIMNNSIVWVKFIDRNETLPPINLSEALSYGIIENTTLNKTGPNPATPGFMPGTAIAAIALSLLIIKIKRKSR